MCTAKLNLAAVVLAGSMLVGCAAKPKQTGFLSDYKNLEPKSATELVYVGPTVGGYSKFIVDPVTVRFYDQAGGEKIKQEDIDHLQTFFHDQIVGDLSARYPIVAKPGPAVGRLRVAITNLKAGSPALNVLPQTKLTGMGLGAASGEMELVDSITGAQAAAAVVSQTGSRLSLSGLSKWGDAEAVMKDWSGRIRDRIVEAHEPAK